MEEKILEQMDAWIDAHRDDIVKDIKRLVDIRSVSEAGVGEGPFGAGCKKVLEEMLQLGKERGYLTENFYNTFGSLSLEEGDQSNTVGFWGHLDVVPEGDNWEYEPYQAVEKNGYLIGRGSQDNKGPTIAVLYLLLCFKELGISLKHHLKLYVGCDEEKGMADLEYFTAHYPCPRLNIIADCGFPVCYGEKGIIEGNIWSGKPLQKPILSLKGGRASNMVADYAQVQLEDTPEVREKLSRFPDTFSMLRKDGIIQVTAYGVSKHTAFPEGGVNAIYLLTRELQRQGLDQGNEEVIALYTQVNRDFYGTGLEIVFEDEVSGKLTCVGSMLSCQDGKSALGLNIRYPITADSEELIGSIKKVCESQGCTFELDRDSKPNYFPKEHPVVGRFTEIYNQMTGSATSPYVMGGGTYARKLPHAFAFGMGMPYTLPEGFLKPQHGGGHEPDEALNIEKLLEAMKIYCRCLISLDDYSLEG